MRVVGSIKHNSNTAQTHSSSLWSVGGKIVYFHHPPGNFPQLGLTRPGTTETFVSEQRGHILHSGCPSLAVSGRCLSVPPLKRMLDTKGNELLTNEEKRNGSMVGIFVEWRGWVHERGRGTDVIMKCEESQRQRAREREREYVEYEHKGPANKLHAHHDTW